MTKSKCQIISSSILFPIVLVLSLFLDYASGGSSDYASYMGIQEYTTLQEANDFTLKDVANKKVSLKDFKGKVVMLNFWATWCGPCRVEMPSMEKLYRQFREKGFVILAVASGDDTDSVDRFVKDYNISFPALIDSNLVVSDSYKVWALPTTYFINAKGQIIGRAHGGRDWGTKEAAQYITSLLQRQL
ncbi:MAG: TlpA family protein disulfide reductase [Nitrospirae bacterium]|nr:TlpA family protein disulfide reductase [Nitrospirota bacterium]